ncbi:MAG: hypothetical protein QXY42_03610 [Candidatus Bathyarchaeia archaeon]
MARALDPTSAAPAASALFALGFLSTQALLPLLSKALRKKGIVGEDVHKPGRPLLPEMCGLAVPISMTICTLALIPFSGPQAASPALALLGAALISAIIGARDDLKPMGPRLKPLLLTSAAIPILALRAYSPFPSLPFIGRVRLTLVYPLAIPLGISVTANAVNMMDVFNGSMTGTCSIILATMALLLSLSGKWDLVPLPLALLGSLLALHRLNRYPAKVFIGDVGDLCVGASIGALAIIGGIEVPTAVAMMPHIMNAFYGLSSMGGLYERRQAKRRPVRLEADGRLAATSEKAAPITLARIILADGPLREWEVVKAMAALTTISSALAILTFAALIPR